MGARSEGTAQAPRLEVLDASLNFDAVPVLSGIRLTVSPGELVALVGPNGAGKSTLLHVLAGDLTPDTGHVEVDGRVMRSWRPAELAQVRAVLTQANEVSFSFSVAEVVAMGLAPWIGLSEHEEEARISAALGDAELSHLAARRLPELSGGERARVAYSRVRAQGCEIVLLDEPTASLDIRHQERLLGQLRSHADAGGCAVIVLHDLNLAAAYAHRIVVLDGGRIRADGPPATALDAALLSDVYRHPIGVERHPASGALLVHPVRRAAPAPPPSPPVPHQESAARA
ncbi:heme ABC transporter ATP-binding protein [Subtercola boreus]|uniref:Heme ABC transporter ATP-binding protein n=1 Tax=Subtercola boreus TaxID=120213 RepID=A0A3E0W0H1_9MICO|nr:heme ABC transporter ATP-binding protein [Subtercola boreus]RFA15480.1 heme ABC transporter ATP-binding protein [Subtercola boreus]